MHKKSPEIRFKGFTDDWEQRKLGDIYKKIRNAFVGTATPYYVEEGNFYLESNNVKDGNINRKTEVFINDEFYVKQKDKWLKTGDLVMVQSGHVGHTAVIPEELNNTAAHALIMFQEKKRKTNPYFLNYQFLTNTSKRKLDMITTGNTIKHILASEMKIFEVFVCENDEENLIADFFQALDGTIALHQDAIQHQQNLKKAMLQKLFPVNGDSIPTVRFANFKKEWEQRKLGDITESYSGGTPSAGNTAYYGGDIPFIRSGEINDSSTELFITEEGLNTSSAKMVDKGDILYALYGATSGEVGISKIKGAINQAILAIRPIKGNDSYLIIQWLKKQKNIIIGTYLQGGQGNLSGSIVKDLYINLPTNLEEQILIGTFFKQLDGTIALHQDAIHKLQLLKQSLLQKMFV